MRIIKLHQAGDTIVEVLIAMSVISLVMVGAYGATTHNTADIQDAQERSEAVRVLQSQVESLSIKSADILARGASKGCFDANATPKDVGDPACTVRPNGPNTQPAFLVQITGPDANNVYSLKATWTSLASSVKDEEVLYYKPI